MFLLVRREHQGTPLRCTKVVWTLSPCTEKDEISEFFGTFKARHVSDNSTAIAGLPPGREFVPKFLNSGANSRLNSAAIAD